MTSPPDLDGLRAAVLQAIVGALREAYQVSRCTLRLDAPGATFPVVHEALAEGADSLVGEASVTLSGQPVVEALRGGADQVVQDDCATASADPAFRRMLVAYGGLAAQVVTAVRIDGRLIGIVSLHALGAPRTWTPEERRGATEACTLIARVLV